MSRVSRSDFEGELLLYDSAEAANYLGCCRQTIQRLARSGRLPGAFYGGGWKFSEEDLRAFRRGQVGQRRRVKDQPPHQGRDEYEERMLQRYAQPQITFTDAEEITLYEQGGFASITAPRR